jgi:Uma2 family endonuclease
MVAELKSVQKLPDPEWPIILPPDYQDLIFDDGEPLESNRHRLYMNVLIRSMAQGLAERKPYFVGGNMFIYYSSQQVKNRDFRGPDFFVVLDVEDNKDRLGWVVWEEAGRYPDVIIELMSPSTRHTDTGIKKTIYGDIFRTSDYYVFDPFEPSSLQGWHLDLDQGYQPLMPNAQGQLWSKRLNLWVGPWQGKIEGLEVTWLRFFDPKGDLVLLPEELAQQQAELAQQQAGLAQQQAELAEQKAEQEYQRAERLAAKLRELGLDPSTI